MIGLDIGTYSIKAVELKKTGNAFTLEKFKVAERAHQEPLSNALAAFFDGAKFIAKDVNISVSGHLAQVRLIELPQMSDAELRTAAKFEAGKFVPFNADEAVVDYRVISKAADTRKVTVLLAATKRDFVKNYCDAVSHAGFNVTAVDVDGIAITNAFLNASPEAAAPGYDKAFAILNIGDAAVNMSVVYNGAPYVVRDISGGGKEIAEAIEKSMGVDRKEAYRLKHEPPSDKRAELLDIIKHALDKLCREVRFSLGYFENQFSHSIETIYLCGGSSRLFGLKEFFAEMLETQTQIFDPLASIAIDHDIPIKPLEDAKPELAVAVGLAVRDDD